jgi:hypothetical protein
MEDGLGKITELLNDIESNCDLSVGSRECTQFSLDCLALIGHKLPPVAVQGVAAVIEYASGRVSLQVVIGALAECWHFL